MDPSRTGFAREQEWNDFGIYFYSEGIPSLLSPRNQKPRGGTARHGHGQGRGRGTGGSVQTVQTPGSHSLQACRILLHGSPDPDLLKGQSQ